MKKAFSMIEVIFVIVILGIVASISSQIIVQVYENYITQRAIYNVNTKTEIAINQIVNRLTYSILDSAIARDPDPANAANYKLIKKLDGNAANATQLTVLEWVGYDNDSFAAAQNPHWSGVSNYDATSASKANFDSPGSNLSKANTIIQKLSYGEVGLSGGNSPAVVFQPITGQGDYVNGECMGMVDNNISCIYGVKKAIASLTGFRFINTSREKIISERYQLAWSAYALVPKANTNGLFDLNLHYNYQPWLGEHFYDNSTKVKTLIKNISVFKFTQSGSIIQVKLCATENIGKDYNISTCKEKAIIR